MLSARPPAPHPPAAACCPPRRNVCRVPVTVVPMGLDADGLPVAIQVVGAERFDRLTIAVAQALEHAGVAGWLPPAASSTCPKCRIDSGEAAAAEAAARGVGAAGSR